MWAKRFEELLVWQKGQNLAVLVYQHFKDSRDWGFKDQICRAAVSVSNNIAEGFERNTAPDFARFLFIAKGSCSEVRSMLYIAQKLELLDKETTQRLIELTEEISKMLIAIIRAVQSGKFRF